MCSRIDEGNGDENVQLPQGDDFSCYTCREKLQEALMCPHCSRALCRACARRRWGAEAELPAPCPHCDRALSASELVQCRWVVEVTQQIDTLRETLSGTRESLRDRRRRRRGVSSRRARRRRCALRRLRQLLRAAGSRRSSAESLSLHVCTQCLNNMFK